MQRKPNETKPRRGRGQQDGAPLLQYSRCPRPPAKGPGQGRGNNNSRGPEKIRGLRKQAQKRHLGRRQLPHRGGSRVDSEGWQRGGNPNSNSRLASSPKLSSCLFSVFAWWIGRRGAPGDISLWPVGKKHSIVCAGEGAGEKSGN